MQLTRQGDIGLTRPGIRLNKKKVNIHSLQFEDGEDVAGKARQKWCAKAETK